MKKTEHKLYDIAYARSGDKGINANIGVIAYTEEGYHLLAKELTESAVKDFFSHLHVKEVKRYLLPNLYALNFVLLGALGDENGATLRLDAQGKALGQALLEIPINNNR